MTEDSHVDSCCIVLTSWRSLISARVHTQKIGLLGKLTKTLSNVAQNYYLCQKGYVLLRVCLSVCLIATSRKTTDRSFYENFIRDVSVDREELI